MAYYCKHSILENCKTNREVLKKIYEHALKERPERKRIYRPEVGVGRMPSRAHKPLTELYPNYCEGDYVYFSSLLDGQFERKVLIRLLPDAHDTEVWFNGERIELIEWFDGFLGALVNMKKGRNTFLARVRAKAGNFDAEFLPIVPEVCVTTHFYLYSCWHYFDEEGFRGQRGFMLSRLYRKNEPYPMAEDIDWIYPVMPNQSNEKKFDFNMLCGKGRVAYSYTHVCGGITINHNSPLAVFENGVEVYRKQSGMFTKKYSDMTPILIRSSISENNWGFVAKTEGEHSLPFVEGADCPDLQWLWIGPFGCESDGYDEPYAPEFNLQFEDVYSSIHGPKYWNFYRENTILIQTLQSNFYGQWFYALMVGLHGMKLAAAKLRENKNFTPYFINWMNMLCSCRDYGKYEYDNGTDFAYLTLAGKLDRLDPIGTIGINMADYYMMTGDSKAKYVLKLLADSLQYEVPRFSDGTLNRVQTMWTDDTYMSLPFLVRLGAMTGDKKYFDDILTQVRGFLKRMWMEDEKLFSHIYFVEEEKPNCIPWGRGNGWVLLALSEVLLFMPESYHGREEILSVYSRFAEGVLEHRDKKEGIWHQVINNPESYIESSGSAMFITALARGVRMGWLDADVGKEVECAWNSLLLNCVDENGNLYGVCMGSGCNMEEQYYLQLETIVNDDHGVGIVLGAGVEVMNMLGE